MRFNWAPLKPQAPEPTPEPPKRSPPIATVRPGWKLPEPPKAGAVAIYYIDIGEVHLGWDLDGESVGGIDWPFVGDHAVIADLEAAGFEGR